MTKEEYSIKSKELAKEFEKSRIKLAKEYADSNNPYMVGDKISDHIGKLIIEGISYYLDYDRPSCVYRGQRLTKTGNPIKGKSDPVFQINIIAEEIT